MAGVKGSKTAKPRAAATAPKKAAEPVTLGAPELTCYPQWPNPPELVPGRSERVWMDLTSQRYAYRCIPLSMANASGWEIRLPFTLEVGWNGGDSLDAIRMRANQPHFEHLVSSHFGHGVVTFHTGWLFRTSPGWALWTRGPPNSIKDGIVALDGLVETDWLPFSFTMNWRFTRPGIVRFEAGEPFCFIHLVPHALLDDVQPRIGDLEKEPKLKAAHDAWSASRADFGDRLKAMENDAVAEKWQRTYVQGRGGVEGEHPMFHLSKRRLKAPK
jgi:hypothetical protein